MSAEVCSLHRRRLNSKKYYYPLHPENWQACCSKAAAWIFSLKGGLFLAFSLAWLSAAQRCQTASCFLWEQSAFGPGTNCSLFIGQPEGETTALHWCQRGLEAGVEFLRTMARYVRISRVVGMTHSQGWLFCHTERQRKEGSGERQQRAPTLRDAQKIGPCLSELGMTDSNSNSLH